MDHWTSEGAGPRSASKALWEVPCSSGQLLASARLSLGFKSSGGTVGLPPGQSADAGRPLGTLRALGATWLFPGKEPTWLGRWASGFPPPYQQALLPASLFRFCPPTPLTLQGIGSYSFYISGAQLEPGCWTGLVAE